MAESLAEQVTRFMALAAKKKGRKQLETRLTQEKQFNRKVALNGELRTLDRELQPWVNF